MFSTRLLFLSVLMLVEALAVSARAGGPNKRMAQKAVQAYVAAGMTGTQQMGRFTVQPVPHAMNALRAVTPPQPEGQALLPRGDHKVVYQFHPPGRPGEKVRYIDTTIFRKNTRSWFSPSWRISHRKEAAAAKPTDRVRWQTRGPDGRFGKVEDPE